MPQAVNEYLVTNNFKKVDLVKRDILKLYEDDFKKIDSTGRISLLFDSIPAQLNKNASRYQVSSVLPNSRADDILRLITEMVDSKTVLISYHVTDPNAGLSANKDLSQFKLFVCFCHDVCELQRALGLLCQRQVVGVSKNGVVGFDRSLKFLSKRFNIKL